MRFPAEGFCEKDGKRKDDRLFGQGEDMYRTNRVSLVIRVIIVALISFCAVNIVRLRSEYEQIEQKKEELLLEKETYQAAIDKMKAELQAEMDEEYLIRIAHDKLDYYLPDEIIFYQNRS